MYTFDSIQKRIKEVFNQEALDQKKMVEVLTLMKKVIDHLLEPEEEIMSEKSTVSDNDLDELIKKDLKTDKLDPTSPIPLSFFMEHNYSEILDSATSYGALRKELLAHSKILRTHPNSPDYLLVEV